MAETHLIVGLGNPGPEYDQTRHNIGFRAVTCLAERWGGTWSAEKKFKARMSRAEVHGTTIHLCQPQTYMNLSGEAVGAVCDYYRIQPDRVLAVNPATGDVRRGLDPDARRGGLFGTAVGLVADWQDLELMERYLEPLLTHPSGRVQQAAMDAINTLR